MREDKAMIPQSNSSIPAAPRKAPAKLLKRYKKSNTVPPIQVRKDNILKCLRDCRAALAENRPEDARQHLLSLRQSLDYTASTEIAFGLVRLYHYVEQRIETEDSSEALRVLGQLQRLFEREPTS